LLELAPDLEAALLSGHTVVVPTAQRAAALRLGFAAQQLRGGRRAFRTPDVQSLSGWLRGQPAPQGADGQGLRRPGASEEWLLWRAAVGGGGRRGWRCLAAGLVDAVRRSAALLYEWRILAGRRCAQAGTPEALLLMRGAGRPSTRASRTSAPAPPWRALQDLARDPPRDARPLFAGFALPDPGPSLHCSAAWAQRGTAVAGPATCAFAAVPRAASRRLADPELRSWRRSAHWCRERLSSRPRRRGCWSSSRTWHESPDARCAGSSMRRWTAASYAVEGGRPLTAATRWLPRACARCGCWQRRWNWHEISQWLRASFWLQPPASRRAMLDAWLRTVVPPRLNAAQLLRALRAAPPALLAHADEVAALLMRLMAAFAGSSRATLGAWSGRFAQVLGLCGLHTGAARQRDSRTQQVLQRLEELLQECAALPACLGAFNGVEAVAVFARLLARTRFEPATGDAAVTITASFADPVLRYDGIWVSGLHAGVLPQRARFDPFIPASLQRQAGVIAADAAGLVGEAERALDILCRSSREFVVSAPEHVADLELAASPLLAPYALETCPAPSPGAELPQLIRASRRLETFIDEVGAAWPDAVPLPAGTRALELQSRCPFRAYAQLRLGAEPLESPVPGITPRERGRLLHRALELLWQGLGGSAGLALARANQIQARLIGECIAQAGSEILDAADPDAAADATGLTQLRRAAIGRELGRAARLINALCDIEAARTPFVVHEVERAHRVNIGGALLNVRIDRIDRLSDGSHVILDYKSGRAVTPDWEVERTTHPQLLVYLLAAGGTGQRAGGGAPGSEVGGIQGHRR
jgi:probable DNA repair protein